MVEGFQKIDLASSSQENISKSANHKTSNFWKWLLAVFAGFFLIFLLLGLLVFFPGRDLYFSIQKASSKVRETYTAIKTQDLEETSKKLAETKESLTQVQKQLSRLGWLKYIPLLGSYDKDAEAFVRAGLSSSEALEISINTLIPYSDLLGFKGKSTFVAGSADDRIKTAVDTLDKVVPSIDEIAQKVSVAGKELEQIDTSRYPDKIGSAVVKKNLEYLKNIYSGSAQLFVDAQPLLKKLPDLLGSKEPKTYLIIFQNDAELRATGGFITAYAIFQINKGKMQVIKASDIYKLDDSKKKKFPAPSSILKYHKNVYSFELRDSNLSPDFVISMQEFERMLKESVPDFPKFDGVIALDTHVLVSTIKVLGDFNIYGRVFSAEKDSRCDCPKVIYELEDYATKPVAYVREERKDIIGVLLYQVMQRALGVSPSKYWGRLFQMFLEEAQQKHILFYIHDEDAEKGLEALNFSGRIKPFEYDYIHINDVNFAGAKSNLFVEHEIKKDINFDNDGTISSTLTINYKNPSPPSNCNLEAGQLCLNGILRNWLRLYVPKGSTLLEFTGSEKDTVTYDELDKTVFEGFLTVKPQASSTVVVRYKLPFKKSGDKIYKLLVQKQPGTDNNEWTILSNGKKIDTFPLLTDYELNIKL